MKLELERGDDSEIAAAAAQRPEQVGVLRFTRAQELALSRDHVGGYEVVDRQPELAGRPAKTAAQGKSGNASGRIDAKRRHEPEGLRLPIEIAESSAWLDMS